MVVTSKFPDDAASTATVPEFITAGGSAKRSTVWADFVESNNAAAGAGAAATATCRLCDKTFCSGGKNGTSHLHRHIKRCRARAEEEQRRQPAAAEHSPTAAGEQDLDQQLYVVDGINIPELFDELEAKGLVHIDDDAHFRPNLPQAANSSSIRFFQRAKQRKRTEQSKKRCLPDDGFISHDQLSARGDFGFKEKKMLANTAIHVETGTTSGDYSCGKNK